MIFNKRLKDLVLYQIRLFKFDDFDKKIIKTLQTCEIIILLLDLSNRDSWEKIPLWVNFLINECALKKFYLIGNKKNNLESLTSEDEVKNLISKSKKNDSVIVYETINSKDVKVVNETFEKLIDGNSNKVKFENKSCS